MGLIITPREEIDKYFSSPALSQSKLKELQYGLDKFLDIQRKKEDSEKLHFVFGKAVDIILTGNEGDFEKEFYVSTLEKKPSDTEISILQLVFNEVRTSGSVGDISDYQDVIKEAVDIIKWQSNWKLETRINKIIEVGSAYFEDLRLSDGKTIITETQFDDINTVVTSLKSNERTSKYFLRELYESSNNFDMYLQLPVYFKIEDVECKALLDMVLVEKDDNGKAISIQPFDVKTKSGYTIDFPSSAKSFRYDIQSSWYSDALLNETATFPNGFPEITEDTFLKPFTFIVESSTNPGKPLLFQVAEEFIETGRNGYQNPVTGKIYNKGYFQLVGDYIYYEKTGWVEEEVVTRNNGVLELRWDNG